MTAADVAECACSVRHQPAALSMEHHHVWPEAMGGPTIAANMVWLCPTAHTNVHDLLRRFLRDHRIWTWGELTASYNRPVSRYAYRVAAAGFIAATTRTVTLVEEA